MLEESGVIVRLYAAGADTLGAARVLREAVGGGEVDLSTRLLVLDRVDRARELLGEVACELYPANRRPFGWWFRSLWWWRRQ